MSPVARLQSLTLSRRDWLAGLFAFGVFALGASGNCELIRAPLNAIVTGKEWVCMPGFSQDGEACKWLMPPANGYVQGNELKCANGFAMQKDETCSRVTSPANAFLTGKGWRCRAGFAHEGDSCIALVVPQTDMFGATTGTAT